MRLNDLSDGSIKTLLILALLFANIALAFPPGSARASRAAFGASPNARVTSEIREQGKLLAGAAKTVRAPALPRDLPR